MNRKEYIKQQMKRHLKEFKKQYPDEELFALCLQGSQNYGLDIYTKEYKSDIDTKAIVIPSLEDIVLNKKPISTTYVLDNNEHIDVKDIRLMFDNFKKQNINFLEILFTNFYLVNKKYKEEWKFLIQNNELIAHYNINQALRCMAGMSMEKKKALTHPYPTLLDKIEKYGYDGKQLHHIIRMYDFILGYTAKMNFKECLTYLPNKESMMKAKLNKYTLEEALKLAEYYDSKVKSIKDNYSTEKDEINQDALNILNKVQYEVIKKKLKEEVM